MTAVDWSSTVSGGAAVQGQEKNRSEEEDRVTGRFIKYLIYRVSVERLGGILQFQVSVFVVSARGAFDL